MDRRGLRVLAGMAVAFVVAGLALWAFPRAPRNAPDFVVPDLQGNAVRLSALRGKVVLLNLWATWCAPCRKEMPALDGLQADLGGKDFEVVALNLDSRNLERRKQFLEEIGVKALAFYADPKVDALPALKASSRVVGLPTTLLIDRQGCELGVMAGPAEWRSPDAQALIRAAIGP